MPILAVSCLGTLDGPAVGGADPTGADPAGANPADTSAACSAATDPDHLVVGRLTRVQYNNTIRDLFGMDLRPADDFPPDVFFKGFDNNSSALSLDVTLFTELYGAAERLAWSAVQSGIVKCDPEISGKISCAREVLAPFARRAWRRTVTAAELDPLTDFVRVAESRGDGFERGIQLAIHAILLAPDFIYRAELPPTAAGDKPYQLDGFALASRLSYFLWSSMPDDTLLAAAETGRLTNPGEIETQVRRMLADPKASSLADELSRQWLMGKNTATAGPDPVKFKFDADLRAGLQKETSLFVAAFVRENLGLLDMLDADFTYLNQRVAKHYGISGITGPNFRKVPLAGNRQRGGLLTQGSVLVGTTPSANDSIEIRGAWIFRNLLCGTTGAPPADATAKQPKLGANATRRQVVEARDVMPECGTCHHSFDPIGLALENYDVAGAWRASDRGVPIDAHAEVPGLLGAFDGSRELSAAIKKAPSVPACMATTLFRFGLGRIESAGESCAIRKIADGLVRQGKFRTQDVIAGLVASPLFRLQGADTIGP